MLAQQQSWLSISNLNDINSKYEAIVNKLKTNFGTDNTKSKIYIESTAHDKLFETLRKSMREIDEAVDNHDYRSKFTKNIHFARDLVLREFDEKRYYHYHYHYHYHHH